MRESTTTCCAVNRYRPDRYRTPAAAERITLTYFTIRPGREWIVNGVRKRAHCSVLLLHCSVPGAKRIQTLMIYFREGAEAIRGQYPTLNAVFFSCAHRPLDSNVYSVRTKFYIVSPVCSQSTKYQKIQSYYYAYRSNIKVHISHKIHFRV